ncbi:hypothetical protein [Thalassococcus lentus]|uniref:Uncharacterized protein n=1 Tax=Thalassococcus lentus TaxID=1210524 RepID=A0ABT4XX11_9RHOB|nr:hypothetical protein [Thalassococcus lentus]MDA7426380.1 hypothetical protein [Thalassococcus lentus]
MSKRNARLERMLHKRLGLSRGDLATRTARARGLLPKAVKRDLLTVAEAARLSGNPRIAPQIDGTRVDAAYRRAVAHLYGPDVTAKRSRWRIGVVAGLMTNLAIAMAMVGAVLVWRGII